jgi:hypothetical protein
MKAEYRALETYTSLPAGCVLHPVTDEDTEPHARLGEFVVVDTNDRQPIVGELYVIERNSPLSPAGIQRAVVQVVLSGRLEDGSPALHVGPYVRNQHIPGLGAVRMLDGAYRPEGLRRQLVGRVIGIWSVKRP